MTYLEILTIVIDEPRLCLAAAAGSQQAPRRLALVPAHWVNASIWYGPPQVLL